MKKICKEKKMKKILSIALTVVMLTALFAGAIAVNAAEEAAKITATNFDNSYAVNDGVVTANGWTGANYKIEKFGFTVDGGDPVYEGVALTELADSDPVKLPQHAGANGVRFSVNIDTKKYDIAPGEHKIAVVAKVTDSAGTVLPIKAGTEATVKVVDASVKVVVDTVDSKPGETVDVKINLTIGEAVTGLKLEVTWPEDLALQKAVYNCVNEKDRKALTHTAADWTAVKGSYIFNFMASKPEYQITGEATFVTLTFKVSDKAAGKLAVTAKADPDSCFGVADGKTFTSNVAVTDGAVNVKSVGLMNVSYDELKYDDTQLFSQSVDKKLVNLEDKSVLDFEEGKVKTITVRGWVRLSEDVKDIAAFGYSIDGADPVFGEFVEDRATELANAQPTGFPGGQGFQVKVPVDELKEGKHTIDVYVKSADGKVIKIVKDRSTETETIINQVGVTFNVNKAETTPVNPGTADVSIVAVAAVSVVALAGAFIGKKALKK